jgi:aspartyl-tRNA(Asn)/glutamyl-tRNA(Gln) amidotransferase subunit A
VWALGSDAGGSVRAPAALTGCVGLRTSIGRWPLGGAPPLAPTLDTPGLLARSVEDLIVGFASIDPQVDSLHALLHATDRHAVSGLRIGAPTRSFLPRGTHQPRRWSLRSRDAHGRPTDCAARPSGD